MCVYVYMYVERWWLVEIEVWCRHSRQKGVLQIFRYVATFFKRKKTFHVQISCGMVSFLII